MRVHASLPIILFWATILHATMPFDTVPGEELGSNATISKPPSRKVGEELGLTPVQEAYVLKMDGLFHQYGALLPFALLGLRLLLLANKYLADQDVISKEICCCCCLKEYWGITTILFWGFITGIRFGVFYGTHFYDEHFNQNFSDHIFLLSSLIALLQTEIATITMALFVKRGCCQCCTCFRVLIPLLVGWALIIVCLFETYVTARFYHTHFASWTAAGAGVFFQILACVWIYALKKNAPLFLPTKGRKKVRPAHNGYDQL